MKHNGNSHPERPKHKEKVPVCAYIHTKTHIYRYIVVQSSNHDTTEIRILNAKNTGEDLVLVQERVIGMQYSVSDYGDQLLILTNQGGATDFKVYMKILYVCMYVCMCMFQGLYEDSILVQERVKDMHSSSI
jgi:hypothetical protein